MKLEFENSQGQRRVIGNPETPQEMWQIINKFLADHNFKSYYSRMNLYPDEYEIDVGSHTEFFYISEMTDEFKAALTDKIEKEKMNNERYS